MCDQTGKLNHVSALSKAAELFARQVPVSTGGILDLFLVLSEHLRRGVGSDEILRRLNNPSPEAVSQERTKTIG